MLEGKHETDHARPAASIAALRASRAELLAGAARADRALSAKRERDYCGGPDSEAARAGDGIAERGELQMLLGDLRAVEATLRRAGVDLTAVPVLQRNKKLPPSRRSRDPVGEGDLTDQTNEAKNRSP